MRKTIWAGFIGLLGVLLPHTAWFFDQFEASTFKIWGASPVAWLAAIVFETAIAILTHKLAENIDAVSSSRKKGWKFGQKYFNAYGAGLILAWMISTIANYAHAVEYAEPITLFTQYGISVEVYAIFSGAILPTCSLLYARVLSRVNEGEAQVDNELKEVKSKLHEAERELSKYQRHAGIFSTIKSEQARAIIKAWPSLNQASIAEMTGMSASGVSKALKGG